MQVLSSSVLPAFLDSQQVAVRYGHFYAYRLLEALGLDLSEGVVRVSMAHYNSMDEVERLIAGLEKFGL
ncbi:aminotransferase class V-fold PLP-dependent enzyme [Deinococcus sp. Marseille-Q6407]|uniref:aminotransferase class V-fold PLP-dependent enzyme n=1 Tax=Deinococcus sp. Marseille-Q6407 TaxID=2969223 RepID=UPI0021C04CBE|nr:aminotransferase class V-fold PLP-dependent enzyme [Deinococcus sp. Marseille-Q6407]